MSRRYLLPTLLALGLGACASVPQQLNGTFSTVTPDQAQGGQAQGSRVRWGGRIIDTEPRQAQTCFFVLAQTLDGQSRPNRDEQSSGRFVACKDGFYDPEVYAKGRDLTVAGTLDGSMTRKVGQYDYNYPLVHADVVYLWAKRPAYNPQPFYSPFYDPFWGPWGAGPWFYPPPVVIVPAPPPPPPKQ
ncbi:MAG: Slp family lipoprotein [Proteobacteria bacterium]|nr:Slp family lipoprotein [Pseudomonadota bacterium]